MKITDDVRSMQRNKGSADDFALGRELEEKANEFREQGAVIYTNR